jgi:hypothetical protein
LQLVRRPALQPDPIVPGAHHNRMNTSGSPGDDQRLHSRLVFVHRNPYGSRSTHPGRAGGRTHWSGYRCAPTQGSAPVARLRKHRGRRRPVGAHRARPTAGEAAAEAARSLEPRAILETLPSIWMRSTSTPRGPPARRLPAVVHRSRPGSHNGQPDPESDLPLREHRADGRRFPSRLGAIRRGRAAAPPGGQDVRALTFDVFGTVVDWRASIIREGELLGRRKGMEVAELLSRSARASPCCVINNGIRQDGAWRTPSSPATRARRRSRVQMRTGGSSSTDASRCTST